MVDYYYYYSLLNAFSGLFNRYTERNTNFCIFYLCLVHLCRYRTPANFQLPCLCRFTGSEGSSNALRHETEAAEKIKMVLGCTIISLFLSLILYLLLKLKLFILLIKLLKIIILTKSILISLIFFSFIFYYLALRQVSPLSVSSVVRSTARPMIGRLDFLLCFDWSIQN